MRSPFTTWMLLMPGRWSEDIRQAAQAWLTQCWFPDHLKAFWPQLITARLSPRFWQNIPWGQWEMWKELAQGSRVRPDLLFSCLVDPYSGQCQPPGCYSNQTSVYLWQEGTEPYRICSHRAPMRLWWQLRLVLKRSRTKEASKEERDNRRKKKRSGEFL